VNPTRVFAEGVVQLGKRRTAIHGKERNGDVKSNLGTAKHDTSVKASRSE
jgi:hypothetical protein